MKQKNWFVLLLAAFLMCVMTFAVPVLAEEEESCIELGTCTDDGDDPENPDKDIFVDEFGIAIFADGTQESLKLDKSIDSEETGADLTALNGGTITLTVDEKSINPDGEDIPEDEDGMHEIYGTETGIGITAEGSGSRITVESNTIDSDATGLSVSAGAGTAVKVTNDTLISGYTAVDIVSEGGNVELETGYVDGVIGISVFTDAGNTVITTDDITAAGYGVVIDAAESENEENAQAPTVTITVNGDITDDLADKTEEGDPGFEPDEPIEEESASKDADADSLDPYDENWWLVGDEEWTDQDPEWYDYDGWLNNDDDWIDWENENGSEDPAGDGTDIVNSTGISISADAKGAEISVDVSGSISMAYGNEVEADNGSTVKVTVGGDVITDYGNRMAVWDGSNAELKIGSDVNAGGKAVDTYTDSGTLVVKISGNISAENTDDGDPETIGIYTNSEGSGNTDITVEKDINVSSDEEDTAAYGIAVSNIGGNVVIEAAELSVSGDDAVGICVLNDPDGGAFGEEETGEEDAGDNAFAAHNTALPPETTITIHGNAAVTASNGGTGAEVWNQNGKTNLLVYGDLTGSKYGLDVSAFGTGPDSFTDILVTGTISGKTAGLIVNDEADNDGTADDNLSLTVWKIDLTGSGNAVLDENGMKNEDVERNIKYIVKIAEGQEDNIKAVDENGNELPKSHGYYYAAEGQRVYLEALNGYDLKEAYNRDIPLQKDEKGFYLDIPNGGAVSLTPERPPVPPVPPVPPHHDDIDDLFWLFDVKLPATGFSASYMTTLPARPQGLTYRPTRLTLQIPRLDVSEEIVTVPEDNGSYPVEWLGRNIGLLERSSLPGKGVTILTGHNHLNTTEAGPFVFLSRLEAGDHIMVNDRRNNMSVYQVYGSYKIASDGFAEIADEVRENALVLITCEDESVGSGYLNRRVILAEPM